MPTLLDDKRLYTPNELVEHPQFMPKRLSPALQHLIMNTALFKAHGLKAFESNPTIVTLWQKHIERSAGAITGVTS